jgi:Protein of unknown function (DUF4019)
MKWVIGSMEIQFPLSVSIILWVQAFSSSHLFRLILERFQGRQKMKRAIILFSLVFVITAGLHASAATREQVAQEAAQQWLGLVDAGHFGESWQSASSGFKLAVTQSQWQSALTAARGPLGKLQKRELSSAEYKTSLPGVPDGEYVVLKFNTIFENKKEAVETVTMVLEKDGAWRATGYFIR